MTARRVGAVVYLTPVEVREVDVRAELHRTSRSGYLRASALGHRPGAEPGTAASAADDWWDRLPKERRAQVFRFLGPRTNTDPLDGQDFLPLDEGDPTS